ncbi:MAG: ribbon-helix-helix domain-containing protein [Candidatus Undinarchaeales archaeon]
MTMETLQIRMPEEQVDEIDLMVKKGIYASRSEAIRTMIREFESIKETIEVFSDPELVKQIEQGIKEIEKGKGIPLEELMKDVQSNRSSSGKRSS